jgi:predicted metal-dependent hydrolase
LSHKSPKIELLLKELNAGTIALKHSPHYLGYFECFNRQMYYEAHDVLEDLWLKKKGEHCFLFYKGLIQLAGAFVHLKKSKMNPAARLFRLAQKNLVPYAPKNDDLDVSEVLSRIEKWITDLEKTNYTKNVYDPENPPKLRLIC